MKMAKKEKVETSRIVLTIIGILFIILLLLTYVSMVKGTIVKGLTIENKTKTVAELKEDINYLSYQKESISKEIEELTSSKDELEKDVRTLSEDNSIDKYVPDDSGTPKSYMCYSQDWLLDSKQYKLHMDVAETMYYDDLGYARLGDRYFVAVKPYYGDIGDLLEVTQADGSVISCIVGDNKAFENDDIYVHYDGSIIEFMVKNLSFKGVEETHPEFYQNIAAIKNVGSYYDQN